MNHRDEESRTGPNTGPRTMPRAGRLRANSCLPFRRSLAQAQRPCLEVVNEVIDSKLLVQAPKRRDADLTKAFAFPAAIIRLSMLFGKVDATTTHVLQLSVRMRSKLVSDIRREDLASRAGAVIGSESRDEVAGRRPFSKRRDPKWKVESGLHFIRLLVSGKMCAVLGFASRYRFE